MINKIVLVTSLVMMLTGIFMEYHTCDTILYDKRNRLSIAKNLKLLSIWILCLSISVFMFQNEIIVRKITDKITDYRKNFAERQINNIFDKLQEE